MKPSNVIKRVLKCVWSGGGYAIWKALTPDGNIIYRLSERGRDAEDFASEKDATNELVRRNVLSVS